VWGEIGGRSRGDRGDSGYFGRWSGRCGVWLRLAIAFATQPADNGGMPRSARASLANYCYHVLNRGNGRARVFHDDDDYDRFVGLLRQACARLPVRLVAYCLMPNHFHLVLWPQADGALGPWMPWLLTAHVHGYRRR